MNTQNRSIFSFSRDPQQVENNLQERSCDPSLDLSLPAEDVLTDHMNDLEDSASSTLFIP